MGNIKFSRKLGIRIKKARETAEISQSDLAKALGLNPISINNYELGHRQPNVETLSKIADLTGCSISYLVRGDESDDQYENPENYYISKLSARQLLTNVSKEYRSEEFKSDISDIIHCIDTDDWGKHKNIAE